MTTAIVLTGLLGALALVLACIADDRAATAATQTTAARVPPVPVRGLPPFAQRAAVTHPQAGRHRR